MHRRGHTQPVYRARRHPAHFEHHDWLPTLDLDPEASKGSRRRICDLAVELDATVTGVHFPVLTLGKIERSDSGYRWVAA